MATHFFWDPVEDNIVQERDDAGAITAEYATEPYLYGNLISQNRGGVESQYHFDPQGSTLALTDDNQQVTNTYAYTAFGEVTEHTGSTVNPFQYIGQKQYYRDDESEEYEVRRRQLSVKRGRWSSTDLLSPLLASYSYINNSPLFTIDPSGNAPLIVNEDGDLNFCAACTGYLVQWRYTVPKGAPVIYHVVQHITHREDWIYCDPIKTCSGAEMCKDTGTRKCHATVYEYLGHIELSETKLGNRRIRTVAASQDNWSSGTALGSKKGCEIRGRTNINATVRVFKDSAFHAPTKSSSYGWKHGLVNCGNDTKFGKVQVQFGFYLTTRPQWWKNSLYEAEVKMTRSFNCCNLPVVSEMYVESRSSSRFKSSTTKKCMDTETLPELPPDPR